MSAYRRVYGVDAEIAAAVSRSDQVEAFAKKHEITQSYRKFRALVADSAIDVVDICTPPALHAQGVRNLNSGSLFAISRRTIR